MKHLCSKKQYLASSSLISPTCALTRVCPHLHRSGHKQVWKLLNDCLPLWQRDAPPEEPSNSSHIQHEAPPLANAGKDAPAPKLSSNSRAKTSTSEYSPATSTQSSHTRNALLLANYAPSDKTGYQVGRELVVGSIYACVTLL